MPCTQRNEVAAWALALVLCVTIAGLIAMPAGFAQASGSPAQQPVGATAGNRRIGAIKAITGTSITLAPDSGADVTVALQPTTRIVRIAPGEKDLKNATPIQLQDLQVGDRILVGGKPSDDNSSFAASSVVVMKRTDLETRHQQDLQDWQRHGVGGLVGAVDPAAGTVTISVITFTGKKETVIRTSKATVIRRYAPDSVKFDDAKPSTLEEIHPGDQLRARGQRSPDGSGLAADEIVSGSFRNVAGIIDSVDPSAGTVSVHDLLSRKTVVVKVTSDSQLRQLPPEMARRVAIGLKSALGGSPAQAGKDGAATAASSPTSSSSAADKPAGQSGSSDAGAGSPPRGMSGRSGAAPDLQQILSRVPAASLADLHKGDAVMLVSTQGSAGPGTAIQLLSGVEPILQAAPSAAQAMMLAPWSLGAPSSDVGGP